jgi:hypothetical protein
MNYAKRGSAAGTPVIDGGMNTSVAGVRNAIGMTTTTIAIITEPSSFRKLVENWSLGVMGISHP